METKIEPVPVTFRFQDKHHYPSDNIEDFEFWLSKNLTINYGERTYLPITWTAYYRTCNYGKNINCIQLLQDFLNSLDTSKKYFTVIQWDDGVLNNLDHLDCFVFGMSGKGADYNLPLICMPHKFEFPGSWKNKKFFLNFIGRVTHPIRQQMIDALPKRPDYYVSTKPHKLQEYCRIISESVITLCPRGYGPTSFRIQEAMQYGSIPIYISDEIIKPHGMNIIPSCNNVHELLKELEEKQDIKNIKNYSIILSINFDIYRNYFTYEANKKIIETINSSPIQKQARAS